MTQVVQVRGGVGEIEGQGTEARDGTCMRDWALLVVVEPKVLGQGWRRAAGLSGSDGLGHRDLQGTSVHSVSAR